MSEIDPPALNIIQQVTAIRKTIVGIAKLQAKRVVNNILYYCNGPYTTPVYDLSLNLEVLV
jgi:hypothetical protein